MTGIKNMEQAAVLTLKEQVAYQPGQVVSKTLAQNDALSVTLFAFDKGEEISTHESGGDAFVTCLDGVGRITIHEGRNRQIRRLCERAGLTVTRLRRIQEGPLQLGDLKPGQSRPLTQTELERLFKEIQK